MFAAVFARLAPLQGAGAASEVFAATEASADAHEEGSHRGGRGGGEEVHMTWRGMWRDLLLAVDDLVSPGHGFRGTVFCRGLLSSDRYLAHDVFSFRRPVFRFVFFFFFICRGVLS